MTQAEQVKARIVAQVTGQAVVPSIQAEAGDPGPNNAQSAPLRKVIKLVFTPDKSEDYGLYALCDDGTIWQRDYTHGNYHWAEVDGPPRGTP